MMRRALGLVCAAAIVLGQGSAASAVTITPNTFADRFGTDQGACALREAVQAANTDSSFGGCPAGSGADTIPLAAGTYALAIPPDGTPDDNADGDLDIAGGSTLTFAHTGTTATTISGGGVDRVLNLLSGANATVSGLTIRDGSTSGFGGGILNDGATLVLSDSTLTGNSTMTNGGGMGNFNGGTAVLANVTISGNRSSAAGTGGGIRNAGPSTLILTDGTITGNTAADGGGLDVAGATTQLSNTIIAGNTDSAAMPTLAPDCKAATPITSLGFNLIGDTTGCGYVAAPTDQVNLNPHLGPLADNGGPTFTHALLATSPAIGRGGEGAADSDQRGVPRVVADVGAYDFINCGGAVVNRVGTSGDDTLIGTSGPDGILALGGNDILIGLDGKDGLCGGEGNDRLKGGRGGDLLLGQRGRDRLHGGRGKDICKGGPGRDREKGCEH